MSDGAIGAQKYDPADPLLEIPKLGGYALAAAFRLGKESANAGTGDKVQDLAALAVEHGKDIRDVLNRHECYEY